MSLGDYDRWKTDPDWGRRERPCKHCGGIDGECDPMYCSRCETETCGESLVCYDCDDREGTVSKGCPFCRGPMWQCWQVTCARCGEAGCCNTHSPEEDDEWECAACNRREDERERREA